MNKEQTYNLRIIQLVDTLSLGGAEVMAVNLSNLLSDHNIPVLLIATRKGGKAGNRLKPDIPRFIANKKSSYDVFAFFRLLKVVIRFKPSHIHAHSTSIVWASMLKLFMPRVKLIWHDHNGMREAIQEGFKNEKMREFEKKVSKKVVRSFIFSDRLTRFFSSLFSAVIVVNEVLLRYAKKNLKVAESHIYLLQNFAYPHTLENYTFHYGAKKNVIMVANLREQKAHDFLFSCIDELLEKNLGWQILLVGKDFNDHWSVKLKATHATFKHKDRVLFLGEREDVFDLMKHSDIGLLTSKSEALPVTLIEYGLAELPTVCSNVGYCKQVMGSTEVLFEYGDSEQFGAKLTRMINDVVWRKEEQRRFGEHVRARFGSEAILPELLDIYT